MSTFKTALRMALAHPFYLLIYTVFISLMGVFIAASVSWNSSQLTEYKPYDTNVIVVERDRHGEALVLSVDFRRSRRAQHDVVERVVMAVDVGEQGQAGDRKSVV